MLLMSMTRFQISHHLKLQLHRVLIRLVNH